MRIIRNAAVAAVALAVLGTVATSPAGAAPGDPPYFDVAQLPLPAVEGKEIAANVESFSETYAPRLTGTLGDIQAANFLRDEAAALGYEAAVTDLPLAAGAPAAVGRVVTAIKKGATRSDEHIVFVGHYDTMVTTINGAYDNASGTTMMRALAKAFANVKTNRTLMFAWYNGEEEGLLSSEAHVNQVKAAGTKVRAVLGFDMTGIAYPVANVTDVTCLCMWHGEEDEAFEALLRHVNFDVLKFPDAEGLVQVIGLNQRNSDESNWDLGGYPTLRWAGMRAASDYPAYHMPDDTIETIDSVAGGRSFFEQGLRNTLVSAYLTAHILDSEMPVARATASGARTVTLDGAGSMDPDGPPSSFTWDLGDGAKATGPAVTHTYGKAGTYTARLSVGDNIHPSVRASTTVTVDVPAAAKKKKAKKKKPSCKTKKAKRTKRCRKRRAR